jgi:hypothetical protein
MKGADMLDPQTLHESFVRFVLDAGKVGAQAAKSESLSDQAVVAVVVMTLVGVITFPIFQAIVNDHNRRVLAGNAGMRTLPLAPRRSL